MRRVPGLAAVLISLASALLLAQSAPFAVLSAGPTGEIRQLQEANEIRVVFSEPMVALGRIPSNPDAAVDSDRAGDQRARSGGRARRS